jgi:hypothetical protein
MGLGGAEATPGAEGQLIGLLRLLHGQRCFLAPGENRGQRAAEAWEQGPASWASTHLGLGARVLPGCGGAHGGLRLPLKCNANPQLQAAGYAFATASGRAAQTGAGPRGLAASPGALVNGTAGGAAAELARGARSSGTYAGLAASRPEAGGELLCVYTGTGSGPEFAPEEWGGGAPEKGSAAG